MTRPLAVRWRAHELPELRAGAKTTARVELENAGVTPWRGDRFTVSYHWLDELGNAIVWDGLRTAAHRTDLTAFATRGAPSGVLSDPLVSMVVRTPARSGERSR